MSVEPATGIVVGALVVAAAFCAIRASRSNAKLNSRLPTPTWDFNQSWASNFGAVGSILGILVGVSSGLPQSDLGLTVIVLSVFFGALILLGPITFLALSVANSDPAGPPIQGTLWGFFVASGLTLWAAIGEAASASALFVDLRQNLPGLIVWLFVAVMAVAVIMLLRYAWFALGLAVAAAVSPAPPGPTPDVQRPTPDVPHSQPRTWPLI